MHCCTHTPSDPTPRYEDQETDRGPELWDGQLPGFYRVLDSALLGVGDTSQISIDQRRTRCGEVEICIEFELDHEPPPPLVEELRATALSIVSLVNLNLKDFLTPSVPFQVREMLPDDRSLLKNAFKVSVNDRSTLDIDTLKETFSAIGRVLDHSRYEDKLRIALELYAAHFTEQQVRVRFLLLIKALESLATATEKHPVAMDLLGRWRADLEAERARFDVSSEESQSLDALSRELDFRSCDSINNQIRKIFADLPCVDEKESKELQRRAVRVYSKHSKLVHDGHLPADELPGVESEARELLEKVFSVAAGED